MGECRVKPAFAAAVVTLLLVGLSVLPVGAQGTATPPASPVTPVGIALVSVRGVYPDAAGHFQDLLVDVNVTGLGTGVVSVTASLETTNGSGLVASNTTWALFDAASGGATLPFSVLLPGPPIRAAAIAGPCPIYLFAQGWTYNGQMPGGSTNNATVTTPLRSDAFAPWWADFSGPPSFQTVDADHDGLYDALVVPVPLQVVAPGPVSLTGSLGVSSSYGQSFFASAGDGRARFLTPGPYTWDLVFPGYDIRNSGQDGPYTLTLSLRFPFVDPGDGAPQLTDTFPTPAYRAAQFEPPSASFRGPITSSREPSALGVPNALEVLHVPLAIRAAGNYSVQAEPFFGYPRPYAPRLQGLPIVPFGPRTLALRDLALPSGDADVDLAFSTIFLSRLPPGQNFTVFVTVSRIGGDPADAESAVWTEHYVTSSSLPATPVAWVNLTASGSGAPCTFLLGDVRDRSNHFLEWDTASSVPGVAPVLPLELYPGSFELYLNACGRSLVEALTVPGSENVSVPLPEASAPPPDRYSITFPSWNRSIAELVTSSVDPAGLRFFADFAGNLDGTADTQELSLFFTSCCLRPYLPVLLNVDGSDDEPVSAVLTGMQGAGPVVSPARVTATVRYDAPIVVPAARGPAHRITMNLYYTGDGFAPYQASVQLPPGASGSLTLTASAWPWVNLTVASNVSVVPTGPGSWTLTPGQAPSAYPGSWSTATLLVPGAVPSAGAAASLEMAVLAVAAFLGAGIAALLAAFITLRRPPRRPR